MCEVERSEVTGSSVRVGEQGSSKWRFPPTCKQSVFTMLFTGEWGAPFTQGSALRYGRKEATFAHTTAEQGG